MKKIIIYSCLLMASIFTQISCKKNSTAVSDFSSAMVGTYKGTYTENGKTDPNAQIVLMKGSDGGRISVSITSTISGTNAVFVFSNQTATSSNTFGINLFQTLNRISTLDETWITADGTVSSTNLSISGHYKINSRSIDLPFAFTGVKQ